ncbi:MAG: hypothetical protein ABI147_14170 [Acidobacteriaceae bacterium]
MDPLNEQHRKANIERIASHTVGIASDRNTGVGTGTLALLDGQKFILTAKHVLGKSTPDELRFWLCPPTAMRDKPAKDTTNEEVGGFTIGVKLQIVEAQLDEVRDVAALRLDPNYIVPEGSEFYDMRRSIPLMKWDEQELDELTLLMFGFPIDNSRKVTTEGNRKFMFMGCAEHMSNYSADLNTKTWARLSSQFSREKDFVFTYKGDTEEYKPHGFSGSGVWVLGETPNAPVWTPDPIMVGIVHTWFQNLGMLIALKLPAFIAAERA